MTRLTPRSAPQRAPRGASSLFFTLLLVAALGLAGCSGEGGGSSSGGGGTRTSSGGANAGGGEPARREFIVIGLPGDAKELDPGQISDTESGQVVEVMYEGLMRFKQGSLEVEPHLATSYEASEDGLTWTFQLRDDVTFHDGTPFNAEAVVINFMRQLDENSPYHVGGGKMEYAEAFFTTVIESVEATGEHEVKIVLIEPFVSFLANLACTPMFMVSPAALEKYGVNNDDSGSSRSSGLPTIEANPVGTGPYKFDSWTKGSRIEVSRYDGYWGEPGATPRLIFNIYEEPQQRLSALMVDEAQIITSVDPAHVGLIRDNDKLTVHQKPALSIGYLELNHSKAPYDNLAFRQALNYAVDKDYIVDTLMNGAAYASRGALPPDMEGALAEPVYPYDPEKAKALLAESGVDPSTFVMKFKSYKRPRPYNPIGDRLATVCAQYFEEIGLQVDVEIVEFTRYLEDRISGEFEIGHIGWSSDNGQADNTIFELFGKESNPKRYHNEEANADMLAAMTEQDTAKRTELYRAANQSLADDAAVVFINHGMQTLATRADLEGFVMHPKAIHKVEYLWAPAK